MPNQTPRQTDDAKGFCFCSPAAYILSFLVSLFRIGMTLRVVNVQQVVYSETQGKPDCVLKVVHEGSPEHVRIQLILLMG